MTFFDMWYMPLILLCVCVKEGSFVLSFFLLLSPITGFFFV